MRAVPRLLSKKDAYRTQASKCQKACCYTAGDQRVDKYGEHGLYDINRLFFCKFCEKGGLLSHSMTRNVRDTYIVEHYMY
jgi:hypothetical protein